MLKKYQNYFPEIGKRTFIADSAEIIGRCKIGKDCSIWFQTVIRADVNFIEISDGTNIQDGTIIHVTHKQKDDPKSGFSTIIGKYVTVGHKCTLHGCTIENNCLIGMNAILLDGSQIGKNSLVAAGSLVTQNKIFPPASLIMGSPAKVIRKLSNDEIDDIYRSAQNYVKYKDEYLYNLSSI